MFTGYYAICVLGDANDLSALGDDCALTVFRDRLAFADCVPCLCCNKATAVLGAPARRSGAANGHATAPGGVGAHAR